MFTVGKRLLSLLFLASVAATPLACVNVDRGPSHEKKDVSVGGKYGVNVDRSGSGTDVKVGGDHGVVVEHPHD